MSSMAVTEFDGRGGNVYGAVNVVRRRVPTDAALANSCGPAKDRVCLATVASNADVFHSSGCRRGPTVPNRNCEFLYALDGYLNVHTRTQVATRHSGRGTVVVADPRLRLDRSVADDFPHQLFSFFFNVRPGDTLFFFTSTPCSGCFGPPSGRSPASRPARPR
jgi:hypothetical protein